MDFVVNETPVEVIKEDAFGGAHFRDIYPGVIVERGTKSQWKNSISWKILIRSFIAQVIKMLVLVNMMLNAEHS